MQILSLVSNPDVRKSTIVTDEGDEEEKVEQVFIFTECPYAITLKEYEKTGLDIIFYGQDHCDTMAILMDKVEKDDIPRLKETQKLVSNKELMSKNFQEVIENLTQCESYINDVLEGNIEGDSELGRNLDNCLGQFSTDSMDLLESLIASNYEDALMINSLSKL